MQMLFGIIIFLILSVLFYAYTDNDYLDFWKGKALKSKSGRKFGKRIFISVSLVVLLFFLIILFLEY